MHPTGPLAIWVLVAIACAAVLTVEGALFLSSRQRRGYGWQLGVSMILGSLIASALAARLFDIRARLIYGPPLQWTDPRITTPLAVGTVLGSLLLLLTAYGSVRALRLLRSPAAPVAEGCGARAWSFSWSFFLLAVMADVGAWILANGVPHLAETAYLIDPVNSGDDLGLLPFSEAVVATVWGALVLILPLSVLLVMLRRSARAFPALAERWLSVALSVATVAVVLAAFFAAADEELANFLLTNLWFTLQIAAWFVAVCAFVVAVSIVREVTQRGAGIQR